MAHPVKFMSLQKAELEYEVAIRGETPATTVQELRKQIAKCGPMFPSEDILTSPFEVSVDLSGVLEVLTKAATNLESSTTDKQSLLKIQNLLNHAYHRINRITCGSVNKTEYDECVNLYKSMLVKSSELLASASDPLSPVSNQPPSTHNLTSPIHVTVSCDGGQHKFAKLKFEGNSCVRSFLQRVNELCHAKGIPTDKILTHATEIFTGGALHWYRSIRDSVSSWDELANLLKRDFDQSDYDYRLLTEIRARTQGESENIVIYLSIMTGLFSRLTKALSEEDKLELLLHNIRPCYANILSSVAEIKSIEQLRTLCRNYENIQSRLAQFREPPRPSSNTLAPEFAYSGISTDNKGNNNYNKRFNQFNKHDQKDIINNKTVTNNSNDSSISPNYVHAIDKGSHKKIPYCPRCRSNEHAYRNCTVKTDEIFCFGCGQKDIKRPACKKCSKNSSTKKKN